jgi:hypothetical protein
MANRELQRRQNTPLATPTGGATDQGAPRQPVGSLNKRRSEAFAP